MYRTRSIIRVTFEGWNGAIENAARINEVARRRGWQEATVWTQTFGPFGELAIEVDYPDHATYERETAAYFDDEECMKLLTDGMKYVRPGQPWLQRDVAARRAGSRRRIAPGDSPTERRGRSPRVPRTPTGKGRPTAWRRPQKSPHPHRHGERRSQTAQEPGRRVGRRAQRRTAAIRPPDRVRLPGVGPFPTARPTA
jgi:hypothetical protein